MITVSVGTCAAEWVQPGGGRSTREIIAAFERETGKPVDLEQPSQNDIEARTLAAVV